MLFNLAFLIKSIYLKFNTTNVLFKVLLYSVLNGLNHKDSAIKC